MNDTLRRLAICKPTNDRKALWYHTINTPRDQTGQRPQRPLLSTHLPAGFAHAFAVLWVTGAAVLALAPVGTLIAVGARGTFVQTERARPAGPAVAGSRHRVTFAAVGALAGFGAALAVGVRVTGGLTAVSPPAGSTGAVAGERVAVGSVQTGALIGAAAAPGSGRTRCKAGRTWLSTATYVLIWDKMD